MVKRFKKYLLKNYVDDKSQTFQKEFKCKSPQKMFFMTMAIWTMRLKLFKKDWSTNLHKNVVFMAMAPAVWLLWILTVGINLKEFTFMEGILVFAIFYLNYFAFSYADKICMRSKWIGAFEILLKFYSPSYDINIFLIDDIVGLLRFWSILNTVRCEIAEFSGGSFSPLFPYKMLQNV